MGYQTSATDASPPPRLHIEHVYRKSFRLLRSFAYRSAAGELVEVPKHPADRGTDLASVPTPLWGLMASYGRQLRAALVHDHLCHEIRSMAEDTPAERAARYERRRWADDLFHEALRDTSMGPKDRVPWFRARLFWAGVSLGREWEYRKGRALVLGAQVLAGTAGVFLALGRRDPRWLLLYAVALLLAAAWGPDRLLALVGTAVGPVVVPALLVSTAAAAVLALPDLVAVWRDPKGQPDADIDPTVLGP